MDEAIRLRVPKDKYNQTLEELGNQINELENKQKSLVTLIGRLGGDTFSGSDVQQTIDLSNELLNRINKALVKLRLQRQTISEFVNATETAASALQSDTKATTELLPDLFK